ncbi:MAG: glycoside hydrolase family 9 protein, partial [Bifidobacteriaceae bacterium]|nr:glycoside hydrolase family 9 protein [Bifidobacteriaceae bacterium]
PDNSSPLYTPTSACRNPDLRGQSRQYNRTLDTITLPMRYVYDSLTSTDGGVPSVCNYPQMKYDLIARPEPGGVNLKVVLRDDLPPQLEESAAFMLEFIPSLYKNKSYQVDTDGNGSYDSFGTLPLAPEDPMDEDWPRADLKYSAWYVEQWNNDKGAQQPRALGRGYSWVLSPEDAKTKVSVTSDQLLSVFDGRNRSQNGWFGMSSRIPKGSKAGTTVASWHIKASVQPGWTREPSIAHSQAGYGTGTEKIAVVETDKNQRLAAGETATLQRLNADGSYTDVYTAALGAARAWTRYNYRDFDFSHINDPGSYAIKYGDVRTEPFPIDDEVYDKTWQHAVSGFMATNMDHMEVREGYKIWHGAAHMDDARMGEHFENTIEAINADDGTPGGYITWFDGQSVALERKIPQVVKDKGLHEGSRVTGINKGGWFDAGDFDIEIHSNMSALRNLIIDAQTFDNLDEYDNLSVTWNDDTGGKAEMHRPDGVADIVQQVKHGALIIQALIENVGWANTGVIEVPTLRQYTHLGDGSTDTDGYIYDKTLAADEIVERGGKIYSGKNDDRMVMMWRSAVNPGGAQENRYVNTSLTNSNQAFDMAGAAAVLKGFDDEFGQKCLDTAKDIWTAEQGTASRANRFNLLVELMLATQAYGDPDYATYKTALEAILAEAATGTNPFAPGNILPVNTYPTAMLIMDLMDASYSQQILDALVATVNAANSPFAYVAGTPFGFAESLTATWGPSSSKVPSNAALLYKNIAKRGLPTDDLAPIRDYIIRGVNYIFGTHPYNDTSWLVGVGANSHKHPYNSNRADEGYIPGSLVPGYINFRPDFPESLDNFSFLWAENEATIGGVSGWIAAAKMADELTRDTSNPGTPAASVDFTNNYLMTVEETEATDPYTGAAADPYETLTTPGLDVFMYNTTFSQIFGDQHAAGVEMVVNGQRLATNGDIHLLPTPEQWDATPAPILNSRSSNAATQTVSANLTLPGTEDGTLEPVEYTMNASPEPGGFKLTVDLDRPLPADLAGKAGFNIELIPNVYKEKSYQADTDGDGRYDKFGIVPLMPFDDMEIKDRARTQDQKWYVQEWNRDRGDYQPVPLASAKTITLAPETDERIRVTSDSGDVQLLDGRNRAQNGWFVLRTLFGPGATSLTWHVQVDVDPSWTRAVNIGHSQAGYAPVQTKQAVMELDPAATAPASASVKRINSDGTYTTVYTGKVGPAKRWLRYDYRTFDFTSVKTPGIYVIEYAGETTEVFPIDEKVYSKSWQQALSGFLAKEMDHIWVREMYKIAHAASHMDDAIMWPLCGEPFRDEASFDGSWFDGQDFCPTSRTNTDYDSLEHIPGLAVGGWYDAGDYDLEATRQAGVIQDLAIAYREFQPTYDTMDVDWAEDTGGYVELHRSDGVPDIVQQVRHGVLNVIARFDAIGYN